MSNDKIHKIKKCVVGLGLRKVNTNEVEYVMGTGFLIDEQGFLMTASHVIKALEKMRKQLKYCQINTNVCVINSFVENDVVSIEILDLSHYFECDFRVILDNETLDSGVNNLLPTNIDIHICRIAGSFKVPFLEIKDIERLNVLDNILTCGYPGGAATLNVKPSEYALTTSPIIQQGIISGIMPHDNSDLQVGIQTDIIATNGSSGSPIIDVNDGKVIGILQQVVSMVVTNDKEYVGSSNMGLANGLSFSLWNNAICMFIQYLKYILDDKGEFIENNPKQYRVRMIEDTFPKPEFVIDIE